MYRIKINLTSHTDSSRIIAYSFFWIVSSNLFGTCAGSNILGSSVWDWSIRLRRQSSIFQIHATTTGNMQCHKPFLSTTNAKLSYNSKTELGYYPQKRGYWLIRAIYLCDYSGSAIFQDRDWSGRKSLQQSRNFQEHATMTGHMQKWKTDLG